MVTTFSPPPKPKAKKSLPVPLIALGAVAVLLLIAVFMLFSKSNAASARANQLGETVVKVAESIGSTNVTAEVLADPEAAQAALDSLVVDAANQRSTLQTTQAELETARTTGARAQQELTAATEAAAASQERLDSVSRDLSARGTELQALQQKYNSDVAALNEEIASLKSAMAPSEAAVAEGEGVEGTEVVEEAVEVSGTVTTATDVKTVKIPSGESHYFQSYSYDAASSNLTLQAIKGGKLTFSGVPSATVDALASAPVFDVYFRFKLMDVYPSKPKDREFMRDLN